MINLDSIYENIIAELIILVLSFLVSIFIPKIIRKDKVQKHKVRYDPLSLAIFLGLVSIFNLILNLSFWNKSELTIFLTLTSVGLVYLIYYVYHNQCPECKRFIRAKNKIDENIIKEFMQKFIKSGVVKKS